MTKVYCSNADCKNCDSVNWTCSLSMIAVGNEYEFGCSDYECYLDTPEYGEEFYALIGEKGKPIGREKRKGKKIEYRGRIFYTQEKENINNWLSWTDAKTGLLVNVGVMMDRWDKFIEIADKQPPIETFPVVEKGADGKHHVVEGGEG